MKRSGLLSIAIVFTLAFAAIGFRCERQVRSAQARQRESEAFAARRLTELHEVTSQIATAESKRSALQAHAHPSAMPAKSPAHKPWKAPNYQALLRQHPELQALQTEAQQGLIRTKYEPLFRQLHLTNEKIARFAVLMAGQEERRLDEVAALQSQHLTMDSEEGRKLSRERWKEYGDAQRELLGADGFAAWTEYERTVRVRETAASFAGATTVRGTPMTTEQLQQLSLAMASTSASYRNGRAAEPSEIDWTAVLQKTSSILSEEQQATMLQIEPHGATNFGGRHMLVLQLAIQRAAEADRVAKITTTQPASPTR